MFKLEIETDNSAFEDEPFREIAHILRHMALAFDDWANGKNCHISVRDSNGNKVGLWSYSDDGTVVDALA